MDVRPVLQQLGFYSAGQPRNASSPSSVDELPKIQWVTAGVLGMMPLHAAGHHDASSTENTLSHVVSSYTTTVTSLRRSVRNAEVGPFGRRNRATSPLKAVIIGMPTSPAPWAGFDTVPDHLA